MAWLSSNGFSCNVVEAKAVFNQRAGRYISSQAIPGMSDIVGNDKHGTAVYIELKSKGSRSKASDKQLAFLKEKILTNCFGVVVDSVDLLKELYCNWKLIEDNEDKKLFLINNLPRSL